MQEMYIVKSRHFEDQNIVTGYGLDLMDKWSSIQITICSFLQDFERARAFLFLTEVKKK